MKFKVDESLPTEAAELLRQFGHETQTVGDEGLAGHPDPEIAEACRVEERILITLDLDFADIRAYPPEQHSGIIVLRAALQSKPRVLRLLGSVIPFLARESPIGALWIVDEAGIRIRRSTAPE
jgi:predicted nuclease of predicted toxin-antitoxin system